MSPMGWNHQLVHHNSQYDNNDVGKSDLVHIYKYNSLPNDG